MGMTFGDAIEALKNGGKVARIEWNSENMCLEMYFPDKSSDTTLPYVCSVYPAGHISYPEGITIPWLPSQTDMLSEDWVLV